MLHWADELCDCINAHQYPYTQSYIVQMSGNQWKFVSDQHGAYNTCIYKNKSISPEREDIIDYGICVIYYMYIP